MLGIVFGGCPSILSILRFLCGRVLRFFFYSLCLRGECQRMNGKYVLCICQVDVFGAVGSSKVDTHPCSFLPLQKHPDDVYSTLTLYRAP